MNNPEIAPPPLADDTVATQLAEAAEGVDLLGLGEKQERPKEELLPGFPATNTGSTKPISDNVNLLDPTPPPSGNGGTFSFLGDLGQPSPAPVAAATSGEMKILGLRYTTRLKKTASFCNTNFDYFAVLEK